MKFNKSKAQMEKLTWDQAREQVAEVNPALAEIIDQINPDNQHLLFKIKYPYGSEILQRSVFYLPNANGNLVPLHDDSIDKEIQKHLCYNSWSNPATLVLNNSLELGLTLGDRSLNIYESGAMPKGSLFGAYWRPHKSHQPVFIWNMTAGARSIFMLPRISEAEKHKKLQKIFQIKAEAPTKLVNHWQVFRELANSVDFPEEWEAEILCFSGKWFEHIDDEAWVKFNYHLMKCKMEHNDFQSNHVYWDLIYSIIQMNRNLKPAPYIDNTVRYLLSIGVGEVPGFAPAISNEKAPIKGLKEVYKSCYGLTKYPPMIMQSMLFSTDAEKSQPVYYSLNFPNSKEFAQNPRVRSSIITDLHHIKSLLSKYSIDLTENKFNISTTPIYKMLKNVKFSFYHCGEGDYSEINESKDIPKEDFRFLLDEKSEFPFRAPFVNGCVKISLKNN